MASDFLSVRPEALLQHRDFVAGLARSLVQAMPRREVRARRIARTKSEDSETDLRDSLVLQQKVVQVVLDLREPFRTIVLLRHYARLPTSQIASRRGIAREEVDAQLDRALEILRERLDAECAGGRAAWTASLLALSRKARALAFLAKLAAFTAVAGGVSIPIYLGITSRTSDGNRRSSPFSVLPLVPSSGEPSEPADPASVEAVRASLAAKSIPELVQVAVQTQRSLRDRLLEPAEDLRRSRSTLLEMPASGFAKLIHRGKLGSDEVNVIGVKGAGSCYSFATRAHGWDQEPDLVLDQEHLITVGTGPGILDLGPLRLEDLSELQSLPPAGLGAADLRAWAILWSDASDPVKGPNRHFAELARALQLGSAKPMAGHAYLVRGISPGRHDVLAAFEALAEDEYGWTIAWRVLRIWPVVSSAPRREDRYWWVPPSPAWLSALEADSLSEVLDDTRTIAHGKLFDPPADLRGRFQALLAHPGTTLTRLLAGDRYGAALETPGSGACFSFASGEHVDAARPDLRIDGQEYVTLLDRRVCGVLLDFGLRTLESIIGPSFELPDDLSAEKREIWEILWNLKALNQGASGRAVAQVDEERVARFVPLRSVTTKVGRTYLLRSIVAGAHDVLVAFTVADRDEHGDWILWRTIWNRKLSDAAKSKPQTQPGGKRR